MPIGKMVDRKTLGARGTRQEYCLQTRATLQEGDMAQIKIAHINEQGRELIIIPLDSSFHDKTPSQREATRKALQACVCDAHLEGAVVLVWRSGHNRYFIAPDQWHEYLRHLPWNDIISRLNKTLPCDWTAYRSRAHTSRLNA